MIIYGILRPDLNAKVKVWDFSGWMPEGEARRFSKRHPKGDPEGIDNISPMLIERGRF